MFPQPNQTPDLFNQTPQYDPFAYQQSIPSFYQVTENDTGMDTVANDLGVPLPNLVGANQNIKTLPPKGSYISLPRPGFAAGPQLPSIQNQAMQSYRAGEQGLYDTAGPTAAPGSSPLYFRERQKAVINITQQLVNGELPTSIPLSVVSQIKDAQGNPVTLQDWLAEGYVVNSTTGMLEKGGTATQAGAPGPGYTFYGGAWHAPAGEDPYSDKKSVFFSRNRGYVTPETANLLRRRRQRRNEERQIAAPAAPSDNAGGTPTTTLQLRLGSG